MVYLSEYVGCLIFLLGGYAYMCNISLKDTLVGKLNYIELTVAWSLAVGFALCVAVTMGGPAYLNPGVVFGAMIYGGLPVAEAGMFLLMEFLAAGTAVLLCMIFFWDSFKASEDAPKGGIFFAGAVKRNLPLNFFQEILATFVFIAVLLLGITTADSAVMIGITGFGAVALLALSLNSTGFSMNAMRSVFSAIWFAILPIPNKKGEKVDWVYQIVVNFFGSSIGGILAFIAVAVIKAKLG